MLTRHKLQAIFRLWDTDKDGAVEQDVVEHALKRFVHTKLSPSPSDSNSFFVESCLKNVLPFPPHVLASVPFLRCFFRILLFL